MPKKIFKNERHYFFINQFCKRRKYRLLLIILSAVFLLSSSFVFALEVEYPELPIGGVGITSRSSLSDYLFYVFNFGMWVGIIAAVFSLIIAGVFYLLSPIVPQAKERAKDRVFGAFSGLLILLTLYLIITTINPQLKFFQTREIEKIPEPAQPPLPPGVYFYKEGGCPSSEKNFPAGYNMSNLLDFTNEIRSVKIVHEKEASIYYIAVLYDLFNFRGKCKYINPNTACENIEPFASSASIYKYSPTPTGNGVTFYRKPFYNPEGGWYKIENNQIGRGQVIDLNALKFKNVPPKEQDCIEWDLKGFCKKREPPTLAGGNIASIKIDGNYFVLLLYFAPGDKSAGPWTFCQAFPAPDDINKEGPKQIKWEGIQNIIGKKSPNWVFIFPVKEK